MTVRIRSVRARAWLRVAGALSAAVTLGGVLASCGSGGEAVKTSSIITSDADFETVHLLLVSSSTGADGGFNFDGYGNGKMRIVIPRGWRVDVTCKNASAILSHSCAIVEDTPLSPQGAPLAFRGASTPAPTGGVGPGGSDSFSFVASRIRDLSHRLPRLGSRDRRNVGLAERDPGRFAEGGDLTARLPRPASPSDPAASAWEPGLHGGAAGDRCRAKLAVVREDLKPDGSAESAGDAWFSRDLPVLMATVALYDRASFGFITFQQVSERTGLSNDVLSRSLRGLRAAGYLETRLTGGSDPGQHLVTTISASARVVAGQWPSESTIVERLLGALEEESRSAPTEEQRAKLRRLREAMIETGTQLVARIIGEVVAPHLPAARGRPGPVGAGTDPS